MPSLPPAPLRDLPVAAVLDEIVAAARSGAVVVTAPPGSGKTMLVPAALLDHVAAPGRVVLLQPRRLAARAVATQIARLRGTPLGGEVGYQVRFDARVGRETRLVVETTGIMLRRLLDDPAVEGVAAVVVDEFHERTSEMDLTLGLLLRAQGTVRPDLRIVVMSATLATAPVARLLGRDGAAPVVAASGRVHPVEIRHGRHGDRRDLVELVGEAVAEALRATDGHVLVFLPGVGEILRCEQALRSLADRHGHALLTLSGDLPPEIQDRALEELGRRKVILSTNVAETSLTIPGVTAVVDSGLARQMRIAAATGLPRLERISISKASADQRAGRAGRTGPGVCWRLWDEAAHHQLPAAETPEILRGDLCGPLLHLLALGERGEFPWLDAPPPEAVEQARTLLVRLGAIESGPVGPADRITPLGLELVRLPAHPRLGRRPADRRRARLLLAGAAHGVLREASLAAALLSERDPFRGVGRERTGPRDRRLVRTRSDVVDRVVALQAFHEGRPVDDADLELHPGGARAVLRTAEQLYRLVESPLAPRAADPGTALMRALVEAFPDRIARLRPGAGDRATMVGGRGVRLDGGSRVRHEPFVVVVDLDDAGGEARVRQASAVEYEWLAGAPQAAANMRVSDELLYHPARRQVEARRRTTWIDLALDEAPIPIADAAAAATILAREAAADLRQVLPRDDSPAGRLLARVRWLAAAVPELALPRCDAADLAALLPQLCQGRRSLDEVQGADWLATLQALVGHGRLAEIDRLAPAEVELAGGRRHRLLYEPGKPPVLAARIQDLFGQRDTPRVAGGRIAVLLHLLGPNHRPQQITDDLAGFWSNTYPRVRTELRRRYPRHAWPDDPLARPGRADGKRGTT